MNPATWWATTTRVLRQLVADRRTIGIVLVVPTALLVLLHFVFLDVPVAPAGARSTAGNAGAAADSKGKAARAGAAAEGEARASGAGGAKGGKGRATRERILAAARQAFASGGYAAVSVRSIASQAGVDQSLVHHYFGTKKDLFLAALDVPFDPMEHMGGALEKLSDGTLEDLGEAVVRGILAVFASPHGRDYVAVMRARMAPGGPVESVAGFLTEEVYSLAAWLLDDPPGTGALRTDLAASQVIGLIVARYVLRLQPLADLDDEQVVAHYAPVLQRYMTGPLPPGAG